jgi:hypothetical protein
VSDENAFPPRPLRSRISLLLLVLPSVALTAQVSVLTQHNDLERTGVNANETVLSPANVNPDHFGMLFKRSVDDQLYTQPLIVSGVSINGGTHDVVYVTTVNNSVYAFDANDPQAAAPIWHVNFGTPASLHDADFGCLDINGNMGIIGTPVIDPAAHALYVVALTKVGDKFIQRLHALDLATGADLPASPDTISAPDFDPLLQNQRPALLLANHTIYIGYASHCDKAPYHGFLIGYDQHSLRQTAVFNASPTGEEASIWQSGQAPAADAEGNIYVVTGNGSWDGKNNLSESFLKLSPGLKLLDWFTPTNHFELDRRDIDLNSSGATLIPGTNLVLGGGKEGVLYVLDRRNLGNLGDEHALQHFPATSSHLHSIVYWTSQNRGSLLYIWGQRDRPRVYQVQDGKVNPAPVMTRPEVNQGHPGAMLSLSSNGSKDGILWAAIHATGDSWHESRPGILHAYDADDINHELWNSLQIPARDDCNNYSKMAPPTIANGKVYLASFGTENVGTGQFCVYGLLPNGAAPVAPAGLAASRQPSGVALSWVPSATPSTPLATTYRVSVAQPNDITFKTLALGLTTPNFTDRTAMPGHTYRYVVTAIEANGESTASSEVTIALSKTKGAATHLAH